MRNLCAAAALFFLSSLAPAPAAAQAVSAEDQALAAAWAKLPTRVIEPAEPPSDWIAQSDNEHGLKWFSPRESVRTVGPNGLIIYDADASAGRVSVLCGNTPTEFMGKPDLFLDAFDRGMLASYKRNGIGGIPKPMTNVRYGKLAGRILRIDVPGSKTTLKCDLTTPTQHFSVIAIGPPGPELNALFTRTIRSIQVNDTGRK